MYLLGEGALRASVRAEAAFDSRIARGARGNTARRVQEWLVLQNCGVQIDGQFGPVTQRAVREFQSRNGIRDSGEVNRETFEALVGPLRSALRNPLNMSMPFGEAVSAFAHQHLAQHPREAGGDNRGPWVRLYMDGHHGKQYLWCGGFVRFCIRQAAEALACTKPITGSTSCDNLAGQGRAAGLFLAERNVRPELIKPGSVFLNRKSANDWTHTGLVIEARREDFITIEGNTNDDGSRNGYEVCSRRRSYRKRDFIVFD